MRKNKSCIDYITKTAQDTRQHASQPLHSSHKSTPVTTILSLIHTFQHNRHPYTQKRGKVI